VIPVALSASSPHMKSVSEASDTTPKMAPAPAPPTHICSFSDDESMGSTTPKAPHSQPRPLSVVHQGPPAAPPHGPNVSHLSSASAAPAPPAAPLGIGGSRLGASADNVITAADRIGMSQSDTEFMSVDNSALAAQLGGGGPAPPKSMPADKSMGADSSGGQLKPFAASPSSLGASPAPVPSPGVQEFGGVSVIGNSSVLSPNVAPPVQNMSGVEELDVEEIHDFNLGDTHASSLPSVQDIKPGFDSTPPPRAFGGPPSQPRPPAPAAPSSDSPPRAFGGPPSQQPRPPAPPLAAAVTNAPRGGVARAAPEPIQTAGIVGVAGGATDVMGFTPMSNSSFDGSPLKANEDHGLSRDASKMSVESC